MGLPSLDERAQASAAHSNSPSTGTPPQQSRNSPGNTMTVKILIADDQVLLSRALSTILGSQPDLEVVATVHDG